MLCGSNDTIFASWGPICSEKTPPDENHHLAPDLEKFRGGVKKVKFVSKKFMLGNDPKTLPASSTTLFQPKLDQFHPDMSPFRGIYDGF